MKIRIKRIIEIFTNMFNLKSKRKLATRQIEKDNSQS